MLVLKKATQKKKKVCTFLNCPRQAQGATDFCFAHGGGRRCQGFTEDGIACPKSAQGATDFCKSHGGGKRCQGFLEDGKACPKSAAGATDFCKSHGGGKRCQGFTEDGKACPKSAEGATDFCSAHGGGRRCQGFTEDGKACPKGAQGATDFCSAHGGGRRCQGFTEDGSACPKSAQGATDFCFAHGGGRRCPNCIDWIDSRCGKKIFDGYCATCYHRLFPNSQRPKVQNYKTKEFAVLRHLEHCFPKHHIVNDRRISDGCSKKKPDFFFELLTHVIMVEVDENAHMSYDQSCENKRMMELSQDIAHRPLVFIRFNPDKTSIGPGCWGYDETGQAIVKKKRVIEWQERLTALTAAINFWLITIPDKTVELIKLYY